ncbi:MAG: hypothetical protein ACPL1A_04665 [Candidatus Kapaibacteriota bacterium]
MIENPNFDEISSPQIRTATTKIWDIIKLLLNQLSDSIKKNKELNETLVSYKELINEKDEQIQELFNLNNTLEEKNKFLTTKNNNLFENNSKLLENIELLQIQNEELKKELENSGASKHEYNLLEEKYKNLQHQFTLLSEKNKALLASIENYQNEINKIPSLENELKIKQDEIEKLAKELKNFEIAKKSIVEKNNVILQKESEINTLKNNIALLESKIFNLSSINEKYTTILEQKTQLENKLEAQNIEISKNINLVTQLKNELSFKTDQLDLLFSKINELTIENEKLLNLNSEKENELFLVKTELEQIESNSFVINSKIYELEDKVNNTTKEKVSLIDKIRKLNSDLEYYTNQIEILKNDNTNLRNVIISQEYVIDEMKSKIQEKDISIIALKEKNNQAEQKNKQLEFDLKQLKYTTDSFTNENVAKLDKEIQNLKTKLEESKKLEINFEKELSELEKMLNLKNEKLQTLENNFIRYKEKNSIQRRLLKNKMLDLKKMLLDSNLL